MIAYLIYFQIIEDRLKSLSHLKGLLQSLKISISKVQWKVLTFTHVFVLAHQNHHYLLMC